MKNRIPISISVLIILLLSAQLCRAQNPGLAKDLAEEGVINEAKIEFLKILHDPSKKALYAEAHYYLGSLSFKEEHYERALRHWNFLLKEYPDSPYSEKAREQTKLAFGLISKQQKLMGENAEINSLFENANLLVDRSLQIPVDSSFLVIGDLAIIAPNYRS